MAVPVGREDRGRGAAHEGLAAVREGDRTVKKGALRPAAGMVRAPKVDTMTTSWGAPGLSACSCGRHHLRLLRPTSLRAVTSSHVRGPALTNPTGLRRWLET